MSGAIRHFLDLDRFEPQALRSLIDAARDGKQHPGFRPDRPLAGKMLAMIFEKPSTRTRVSFEVAMRQLGGEVVTLNAADMQLGRGETVADTARVLSRYVDAIMLRTNSADTLHSMADNATIPVINGLTDRSHPCQVMADVLTVEENKGPIASRRIAWCGDGSNNLAASWIHAAVRFGFDLTVACPDGLRPRPGLTDWASAEGGRVRVDTDPERAVAGADCVVTDTWISMNQEDARNRHNLLRPYQVDERLMALAATDAVFLHCLPAHRGQEVSAGIIDGSQSVVWDEAENRVHAQKAILLWSLGA